MAGRDAVGARGFFHGLKGVNRITRVGVDKAGFNRLLVPYQHPLLSPNHLFLPPLLSSCLESITPTLSLSSLSVTVLGSSLMGELVSTSNDSPRRGVQESTPTQPLSMFIGGPNDVSQRAIRSRISSSMILWRPTKGGRMSVKSFEDSTNILS